MTNITCGHTLDDIVGYQVRLTVLDGKVVGPYDAPIVGRFNQATDYGAALALAHEHRIWEESHLKRYALVDSVYACGHTDADPDL